MTSIFIFEFITGGGLLSSADALGESASLLSEGKAMAAALASDLVAVDDVEVFFQRDRRLAPWQPADCQVIDVGHVDEESESFDCLAASADWTIVIAPEIGGALTQRCRRVASVGGRLLGPDISLTALASDKHALAEHLSAVELRVPRGMPLAAGEAWPRDFSYPGVWKPRDGAGSQGIAFVQDAAAAPAEDRFGLGRLEQFCEGVPVSVAVLCGPKGHLILPPCRQWLSEDGYFRYLGGELPLPCNLAKRATHLAEQTIAALPGALGWLGVDLILGESSDGAGDYVIEVNPRLTTSFVGLSAACEHNLAGAMLDVADGRIPQLSFSAERVQFDAAGSVATRAAV